MSVIHSATRLYRLAEFRSRLFRFAKSRGLCDFDADDLVSQAIERTATSPSFDDTRDPWPYLVSTFTRLAIDAHRRADREVRALRSIPPLSSPRSPEDDVVAARLAVQALERLQRTEPPATVRMVVRYVANSSDWASLGKEFGVSATAARLRVRRALIRVRRHLEPADPESHERTPDSTA